MVIRESSKIEVGEEGSDVGVGALEEGPLILRTVHPHAVKRSLSKERTSGEDTKSMDAFSLPFTFIS